MLRHSSKTKALKPLGLRKGQNRLPKVAVSSKVTLSNTSHNNVGVKASVNPGVRRQFHATQFAWDRDPTSGRDDDDNHDEDDNVDHKEDDEMDRQDEDMEKDDNEPDDMDEDNQENDEQDEDMDDHDQDTDHEPYHDEDARNERYNDMPEDHSHDPLDEEHNNEMDDSDPTNRDDDSPLFEDEELIIDSPQSALVSKGRSNNNSIKSFFKAETPKSVVAIPLFKKPAFPGTFFPLTLTVNEGWLVQMMKKNRFPMFGLFFAKPPKDGTKEGSKEGKKEGKGDADQERDIQSVDELHDVGVLARVAQYQHTKHGALVVLGCIRRIRITDQVETPKQGSALAPISTKKGKNVGMIARIEEFQDKNADRKDDPTLHALTMETMRSLQEITKAQTFYKEQLKLFMEQVDLHNPVELADVAAILLASDGAKLQDILQTADVKERLRKTLELLKQEIQTVKIQEKIQQQLDSKVNETQRKFYLNEQLKIIKKELGLETDEKTTLVEKFKERLEKKNVPEKVQKVIDEEISKFQSLEPSSSEYNICRTYLDWLTVVPWGVYQDDNFDLKNARKVLDNDHYGLKKVKERILEFLAVGKLKGNVQGKIICFVGPPGTGKTSIGQSIARALGREYFRFSVGGVTDVNEIKGHRRTYIGAMPGKLIQIMKQAKTANPLILIDEIDKMGRYHGDPSAALLEALDPEQNTGFMDHYLDVPVDLSKVLFLCTANVLDTISGPLLDRMEVIRLSGYIEEEKVAIAQQYLIPKSLEENGLRKDQVSVGVPALQQLIRYYCRESGVRNLKKQIDKLMRKAAYKIAVGKNKRVVVHKNHIKKYLGSPVFTDDRFFNRPPVGICMGLAWTSMGGSTLYIETSAEKGKENLQLTGKLGDVMKESSSIAYTFAKKFYSRHNSGTFFNDHSIHLHVPEGATPKDGPSAGVTMVTALLSLAFNTPVRSDIAMTGELTLTGKVLEIGGVKEKTIAAKRSGISHILLPKNNKKDWMELDAHIKKGIEATFADTYDDVFLFAFGLKHGPTASKELINEGTWMKEEVKSFNEAFELYGNFMDRWDLIAEHVRTRDPDQCEDYFNRLSQVEKDQLPAPRLSPKDVLKQRGITEREVERHLEETKEAKEQV